MSPIERKAYFNNSREYQRWYKGWKRNATFNGKPLTSSMIRRVGSRENAISLGLIKA